MTTFLRQFSPSGDTFAKRIISFVECLKRIMRRWIFSALSLCRQSADIYIRRLSIEIMEAFVIIGAVRSQIIRRLIPASHTEADAKQSLAGRQHRPSASYVTPAIPATSRLSQQVWLKIAKPEAVISYERIAS